MDLKSKEKLHYGGTKIYMDPLRLKAWKHYKDTPKFCTLNSDAFSFGLSILEMGNLLNLKNIALN